MQYKNRVMMLSAWDKYNIGPIFSFSNTLRMGYKICIDAAYYQINWPHFEPPLTSSGSSFMQKRNNSLYVAFHTLSTIRSCKQFYKCCSARLLTQFLLFNEVKSANTATGFGRDGCFHYFTLFLSYTSYNLQIQLKKKWWGKRHKQLSKFKMSS